MKTIRRLIARLFNIGVDDLSQDKVKEHTSDLDPQLESFISKKISIQVQQTIQDQEIQQHTT